MTEFRIGKLFEKGVCQIDANVAYTTSLGWKMFEWVPIAVAHTREEGENAIRCMNEFYKDGFQNPGQDGLLKLISVRILASAKNFYNESFWKDGRNRSVIMQVTSRIDSMNVYMSGIDFDKMNDSIKRLKKSDEVLSGTRDSVEDENKSRAVRQYVDKAFKALYHFESMMEVAVDASETLRRLAREYDGSTPSPECQSEISEILCDCLEEIEAFGMNKEYIEEISRNIKSSQEYFMSHP